MDDAFKRLEELVSVPAKKKQVLTPEQKARKNEAQRKRYAENPEKGRERARKWRAESPEKEREKERAIHRKWRAENREKRLEYDRNSNERKTADPELFAINQAERAARIGNVTRDITARCPEPARSRLQALVDQIKADPSAGRQVIALLRNMRDLRKLELAEQQQATETTETEN